MNSRQRRKARKALAPVVRAVEGGYFDDLLARPYGPTQTAFAERASQLLGRGWRWPRDAEGVAEKARSIVGELPDGLTIVSGFAEAVRSGWGLAGKLGERVFLARRLDDVREEAEARWAERRRRP